MVTAQDLGTTYPTESQGVAVAPDDSLVVADCGDAGDALNVGFFVGEY